MKKMLAFPVVILALMATAGHPARPEPKQTAGENFAVSLQQAFKTTLAVLQHSGETITVASPTIQIIQTAEREMPNPGKTLGLFSKDPLLSSITVKFRHVDNKIRIVITRTVKKNKALWGEPEYAPIDSDGTYEAMLLNEIRKQLRALPAQQKNHSRPAGQRR